MLSDSIFESLEILWDAINNYEYSEEHKESLITAISKLSYILYKLDNTEINLTEEQYKRYTLNRWSHLDRLQTEFQRNSN